MQCMQILKIKYMNRILVSILLTMGFAYSLSAQEKEYQLVWSDEFDGDDSQFPLRYYIDYVRVYQ